eukprot:13743464-Alexandrium_andersonii.AAC.1
MVPNLLLPMQPWLTPARLHAGIRASARPRAPRLRASGLADALSCARASLRMSSGSRRPTN